MTHYDGHKIIGVRYIKRGQTHNHVKLYLAGHIRLWNANYIYDGLTGQETTVDVAVPVGVWFPIMEGKT